MVVIELSDADRKVLTRCLLRFAQRGRELRLTRKQQNSTADDGDQESIGSTLTWDSQTSIGAEQEF